MDAWEVYVHFEMQETYTVSPKCTDTKQMCYVACRPVGVCLLVILDTACSQYTEAYSDCEMHELGAAQNTEPRNAELTRQPKCRLPSMSRKF